MNFYTNVHVFRNEVLLRGVEDGRRVQQAIPYKPYLFVPSRDGTSKYHTIKGLPLSKLQFEDISSAREYIGKYKDVENFQTYGLSKFGYAFVNDNYKGEIEYDVSQISVVTIDIEVSSEGGFPNIQLANKPLTAITIRRNDEIVVYGLKPYEPEQPNVTYHFCQTEKELVERFIQGWRAFDPDIVTGWNVEFFDIPYLTKRIERLFGDGHVKKLSPWNLITTRKFEIAGQGEFELDQPVGITILDYMALYKKFSFSQQESFKLDHIAFIELGERKLDYTELGFETLDEFYNGDFRNYINYNIRDVHLVHRLEEKLKLIEQVLALAYDGKVNYIDTLTTVGMWDIIIHNHLLERGIVVENPSISKKNRQIEGAYVKDPQVGVHKWVVSFDLNSLYPHLMMQYNISPETLVDQYDAFANSERFDERGELVDYRITDSVSMFIDDRVLDNPEIRGLIEERNVTIAPTGCMFDRDYQGFLPGLMETMYNDRSAWKRRMIEAKKQYELIEAEISRRGLKSG